jgi:hypothetical protein
MLRLTLPGRTGSMGLFLASLPYWDSHFSALDAEKCNRRGAVLRDPSFNYFLLTLVVTTTIVPP